MYGGDGRDGIRLAYLCGRGRRLSPAANLAFLDEQAHYVSYLFLAPVLHLMLRVKVNVIRLQTLQRAFNGLADARLAQLSFGHYLSEQGLRPELVGDDHLVARQFFECLAHKLLVLEVGIHFRRVEERAA